MFFAKQPARALEAAAESSRTTHGAKTAIDACRYMAGLIIGALAGTPKNELLVSFHAPTPDCWLARPLVDEIAEVAAGSFKRKQPPEIKGTGFVVRSLEAALWAFHHTDNFRDGCLRAVNLGDDADTTAAIFGQLAGAYYGGQGIPPEWLARVARRDLIENLADRLLDASQRVP